MEVIKVSNLSYTYGFKSHSQVIALNNINISVNKGEILAIIGHTGSGKSTLIQLLNGLLTPTKGKVFVNGEDVNESKEKRVKIRFSVGLVFQYPEYQLFEESVKKDIAFGPKNMGLDRKEIESRVKEAAKLVGLSDDIMDKSPFDLSGGQMRRVAIAGVIAMRPEILIMDEPSAGLDPKGKRDIFDFIESYHKTTQKTVIIVSHSMEDVAKYAQRVLVMNKGEVFKIDSVENIFKRSNELKEIGLNVPQICEVFEGLTKRGLNCNNNIYTVSQGIDEVERLIKTKEDRT